MLCLQSGSLLSKCLWMMRANSAFLAGRGDEGVFAQVHHSLVGLESLCPSVQPLVLRPLQKCPPTIRKVEESKEEEREEEEEEEEKR